MLLLAVELVSHHPVHFNLVEAENHEQCQRLLLTIRDELRYPLQVVVSDMGKGRVFLKLVAELFPSIPPSALGSAFSEISPYVSSPLPK